MRALTTKSIEKASMFVKAIALGIWYDPK